LVQLRYENGNKKSEGFYKGLHERYGEWKFWLSNGQLACTGIYEDEAEDMAKFEPYKLYFFLVKFFQ